VIGGSGAGCRIVVYRDDELPGTPYGNTYNGSAPPEWPGLRRHFWWLTGLQTRPGPPLANEFPATTDRASCTWPQVAGYRTGGLNAQETESAPPAIPGLTWGGSVSAFGVELRLRHKNTLAVTQGPDVQLPLAKERRVN
jgi:hypothetical protein